MDISSLVSTQSLNQIKSQSQIHELSQIIAETIMQLSKSNDTSLKQNIRKFLDKLSQINTNNNTSPKCKFYSLMIMNNLTERNVTKTNKQQKISKVFSILASHPFLKQLRNIAQKIDPYKQIHQKGKNYFNNDVFGNDYIRLCLELIKYWDSRFPQTSTQKKSNFKINYQYLIEKKVIFPAQYKFATYVSGVSKRQRQKSRERQSENRKVQMTAQTPNPLATLIKGMSSNNAKPAGGLASQINYMYVKIVNYIQDLDGQLPQVQPLISSHHKQFQAQHKKFQNMTQQVLNLGDQAIMNKYFKIVEFMNKQSQFHKEYIQKANDFQSYIAVIRMHAETQFASSGGGDNIEKIKKKIPKAESKELTNSQYNKKNYDSNGLTIKNKSVKDNQSVQGNNYETGNSAINKPAVQSKIMTNVNNYFSRLQQRSKSPIAGGFNKINQSLSKQKLVTKRTISPHAKTMNLSKSINSLKDSKVASIFTSPPNLNPSFKSYQGIQINQNHNIYQQLKSINKSQGLRRFKTANFKGKSSLFQNQHLQIGYKSSSLYEEVNGFKYMIKIQLFFGNLTGQNIKGLYLEFKGDPNILLYANPRSIQSTIFPSQQNRIQLVIIPLKTPFPLLTMNMRYRALQKQYQTKIVIPNSVLKLANFMDISKQELASRWLYTQHYKTSQFKLCHYLPPQTFIKWIPALGQLTNYNQFATPGSNKDYQLFCCALLKINIRPNLNVVVQLGIQDKNQQANNYFKFFLESLQQFLKEIQ